MVDIRAAGRGDIDRIADVLGRAFVTEPMMTWPLGGAADDLEERCVRAYALYVGPLLDQGFVWETTDGHGVLVLVPPDGGDVWDDALDHVDGSSSHDVTDDGGARHERFWEWVASRIPPEPLWHLDSVAVEPGWQGRGIGSALVGFAVERARASTTGLVLETGSPRNVPLYERHGFRVVEEVDPPLGGPHVWFMRRDA